MDIKNIVNPLFIKEYNNKQLEELSSSVRNELISIISQKGGHLSSNLGVVELTIALHKTFDFGSDKLIFDIGHQTYTHKILTGRYHELATSLRQYQGISGYQKIEESPYDHFEAGHAATALAAASGFLKAKELNNQSYNVVAVVGDGGLASGLSFEALNNLSLLKDKMIIVLNDNGMSISKPVGNISKYLNYLRQSNFYLTTKSKLRTFLKSNKLTLPLYKIASLVKATLKRILIGKNFFENLGLKYLGPIDGHDFKALNRAFEYAKKVDKSILVHVHTIKGKGYELAEKDQKGKWHGVDKFDPNNLEAVSDTRVSWSLAFSNQIEAIMANNNKLLVITPAMIEGSKLESIFKNYPTRSFDVGINEEYAFTFASGLSLSGYQPVISVYSTFLQRAYDQVIHDNARLNNNILIGVDRAGLVGQDGDTHHGIYDVAFIRSIPKTIIAMPSDDLELKRLIEKGINNGMFFVRYPRGKVETRTLNLPDFKIGKWDYAFKTSNPKLTVIATGPVIHDLKEHIIKHNLNIDLVYARFYHPIDCELLKQIEGPIAVYDIYSTNQGLFEPLASYLLSVNKTNKVYDYTLPTQFYQHGTIEDLLISIKLDLNQFLTSIKNLL